MPELPEVETIKNGVGPFFLKNRIKNVVVNNRHLRKAIPDDFESRLTGQQIHTIIRRGKYIIMEADRGFPLILHMGMAGRMRIYKRGETYCPMTHDHILFELDGDTRIVYNDARRFGMAYISANENWYLEPPFSHMGPDPLEASFSADVLMTRLVCKTQSVKVALLDQRVVAGIGNIYACEALLMAGILPDRPAGSLTNTEAVKLCEAIKAVLSNAIAAGGSTLRDYRQAGGELGYFQHQFHVYGRESKACLNCKSDVSLGYGIKRIQQAGRSTFFCSMCQR